MSGKAVYEILVSVCNEIENKHQRLCPIGSTLFAREAKTKDLTKQRVCQN